MQRSYNFSIKTYVLGAKITALWNKKAAKWVNGRKGLLEKIEATVNPNDKIVWFHCSSLGEFEQGRSVFERFKKEHPDHKLLITFFSPSGYEVRKNYKVADYVFYLPADTLSNMRRFVAAIKPRMAVFVKYDFWFNLLQVLHHENIPIVYISAVFRSDQHFFRSKGKWFLEILKTVNLFFVQDKGSKKLLNKRGIENVHVAGDTRFDRVLEIAANPDKFPLIEQFKGDSKLILAGSTWEKDDTLMVALIKKREDVFKYIIAPHEIDDNKITALIKRIELNCVRFSQLNEQNVVDADVIIVDTIGHLAHLYQYADLAYVGGGFNKGIHNILEPAAFNIPILFGPNFHKFQEAEELMNAGGAFVLYASRNLNHKITDLFFEESKLENIKEIIQNYMNERKGVTDTIIKELNQLLEKNEAEGAND